MSNREEILEDRDPMSSGVECPVGGKGHGHVLPGYA